MPLDGWVISSHAYEATRTKKLSSGEHGYDNDDPNMRALFIAHGPAFKRGRVVPEFDNVNVYPLLAHLLGIRARRNDGAFSAVADMLERPPR
jgi:predicted AlkP superfamily pyrophosphatase or phosphodiesterase